MSVLKVLLEQSRLCTFMIKSVEVLTHHSCFHKTKTYCQIVFACVVDVSARLVLCQYRNVPGLYNHLFNKMHNNANEAEQQLSRYFRINPPPQLPVVMI